MSKKKTFYRGYKFRIYPTEDQKDKLDQFINLARYAYNWGIDKEREIYEQYKSGESEKSFYTYFDLDHIFRKERDENPEMSWIKDFTTTIPKYALRNVCGGYKRYFKGQNNIPHFKSKKKCKKSFNVRHDTFSVKGTSIKMEGIDDCISLGFDCGINISKVINPVIAKDNLGDYYVSFSLEEECKPLGIQKSEGIGIDLGVHNTFALSTGEIFTQPNAKLNKLEKRRKRQQRRVTRDIKRRMDEAGRTKTKYEDIPKSKRAIKREKRLAKTYKKQHNIKNTFYHTVCKQIVDRNPEYICMETFSSMEIQNRQTNASKYLANTSFYDIMCKMKNKSNTRIIPLIQAPKDYPSSQICSGCGNRKKIGAKRTYKCPVCGMVEDRDINAAKNLKNYGYSAMLPSSYFSIA